MVNLLVFRWVTHLGLSQIPRGRLIPETDGLGRLVNAHIFAPKIAIVQKAAVNAAMTISVVEPISMTAIVFVRNMDAELILWVGNVVCNYL